MNKKLLAIDPRLIDAIDSKRGGLSRAEFLELCINSRLCEAELNGTRKGTKVASHIAGKGSSGEGPYLTREEFRSYSRDTSALLEDLLDYIADCDQDTEDRGASTAQRSSEHRFRGTTAQEEIETSRRPSARGAHPVAKAGRSPRPSQHVRSGETRLPPQVDRGEPVRGTPRDGSPGRYPAKDGGQPRSRRVRREMVYSEEVRRPPAGPSLQSRDRRDNPAMSNPPWENRRLRENLYADDIDELNREINRQNMYPALWIPAILLFGFGDTLTSTMVFAKGGMEANPMMVSLVSMFGGNIIAFVLIKTLILAVLFLISFKFMRSYGWIVPTLLIVVGCYLVITNISVLLSM